MNIGAQVLLLNEPTRGIDVGNKHEIYRLMAQLAEKGVGLIMISSELPEVSGMDRPYPCNVRRHMVKELPQVQASEEIIMSYTTR